MNVQQSLNRLANELETDLSHDTLQATARALANSGQTHPAAVLVAWFVCNQLVDRWDGQAIPTSEFEDMKHRYAAPLASLIRAIAEHDRDTAWRESDSVAFIFNTE